MASITAVDDKTGRKFYLDDPDDVKAGEEVVFLLNLHGGGSVGAWQRAYFPAVDYKEQYRLVVATPSAATKEPMRRWVGEADDDHLRNIVEMVFDKYGAANIRSFWLVGHSQGGMTSNRLLQDDFYKDRVDGWLSLSGGRIGPIEIPANFFPGARPMPAPTADGPRPGRATAPDCDLSFIFTSGEHEMVSLPETSPWAEKYGAGPRQRLADTAFIDYDYNTGRFCSRVAPLWNAGRFTAACNAMSWPSRDHAGHLLSGLVRRRNYEVKLCLSGLQ